MDVGTLTQLLKDRLAVGYSRYGKGLLHPSNDTLDFKKEALEEALDLVIYASADAVRKTPVVTLELNLEYSNDDEPKVSAKLTVNREIDRDGNDAVLENVITQMTRPYRYTFDEMTPENEIMLLGLNVLSSCLNHA